MAVLKVDIDPHSGFCFGVKKAIEAAQAVLDTGYTVYCVGDIVHNEAEISRLSSLGMQTIASNDIGSLPNGMVLFRAHGEPPSSYRLVANKNLQLVDATCPVVLKLQQRIKAAWIKQKAINGQVLIYGKAGHAEVEGLVGQTNHEALVIESIHQLTSIDFTRPIELFSQTTKSPETFKQLVGLIQAQLPANVPFAYHDTTCRQVTGRVPRLKLFAQQYDLIVFVGGQHSSNAKVLFDTCKQTNERSFFVSSVDEVQWSWFDEYVTSVGICGATSTPAWLMQEVAEHIKRFSL